MKRLFVWLVLLLAALGPGGAVIAHEIRPAYLEITEHSNGRADVLWKQPAQGEVAVALQPHIGALIDRRPQRVEVTNSFGIAHWHNIDLGGRGLDGREIRIEGLERTITDVLVVVKFADGDSQQAVLTPTAPTMAIDAHAGAAVGAYLMLGIEHILTGADHLLFVFGLILLSDSLGSLIRTITAFTIAHSITLALTALHLLQVDPALVEAMVAFSIVFLAVELMRKLRGADGIAIRYPWLIAFGFGLLHGAAFAGALKEIGLPQNNIPMALFLFNLGVEIGQLLFVAAVAAIFLALRRMRIPDRARQLARPVAAYAIGAFSMYWFLDRLYAALNPVA